MLLALVGIVTLYLLLKLYISTMQIGYIAQAKSGTPALMSREKFVKAADYAIAKERLSMVGSLLEYLLFVVWIAGAISLLESTFITLQEPYRTIVVVLGFILINAAVSLPLNIYEKFVIDEKFGFNRSSVKLFVKDTAISTLLTIVIGGLIIWGVSTIINSTQLWWLWTFSFLFAIIIALNMFFPTIRALFFDKVTPLDDAKLNAEIEKLMSKTGFVSSGVFVSDASKRDARLNAYFGGLGKSKRVVLFDTLLEKLSHKELLAVLGHELGHFAHGDLYKNIAVVGAMLFAMLALFGNLPQSLFLHLGVSDNASVTMMLFMLFLSISSFIMMPLMGIISRHNEFEADKSGAELGGSEHLASALKKLVNENSSFPLSHPLYMFFYYTHPPVIERIKKLGADAS